MFDIVVPSTAALQGWHFWLVLVCIVLAAQTLGAMAGFGSNLLALPLLTWLCGEMHAPVRLMLMLGILQSSGMAITMRSCIHWRTVRRIVLCGIAGIIPGVLLANFLPLKPSQILVLMGIVIAAGGIMGFLTTRPTPSPETSGGAIRNSALLFLGGVIHGAFACGGPPVVLAVRTMLHDKNVFRATLFFCWTLMDTAAFIGFGRSFDANVLLPMLVLSLPMVLLGSRLGMKLCQCVSQSLFSRMTAALLVLSGLLSIVRNL